MINKLGLKQNGRFADDIFAFIFFYESVCILLQTLSATNQHWILFNTWIKISWFLFSEMYLNMSYVKLKPFCLGLNVLTHWGRVTHICVSNLTIIGSDNGLSPGRRQAITWTNVGILLIRPLGTNFSEMLIEIHTFSFKKIHLKMLSVKWRPFCLGLNVLTHSGRIAHLCVSELAWRQAIIWTNDGILLIGTLRTKLSDIFIEIYTFPLKNYIWKWRLAAFSSRPQCF